MKHTFKTNINCGNCIASVTPFMNKELDIESWEVDTDNPDKLLTVESELSAEDVIAVVNEAGFKAEAIANS
ncbi:MAG: heavy-metal-associated domain-containing protein [Bacteroidia bacterium]